MPYENQFSALAHPIRQDILTSLGNAPASVAELTAVISASQPVVSQHLKVLRDAGLISATPSGTRNIYQIEDAGLQELRRFLETHWLSTLQNLTPKDDPHD